MSVQPSHFEFILRAMHLQVSPSGFAGCSCARPRFSRLLRMQIRRRPSFLLKSGQRNRGRCMMGMTMRECCAGTAGVRNSEEGDHVFPLQTSCATDGASHLNTGNTFCASLPPARGTPVGFRRLCRHPSAVFWGIRCAPCVVLAMQCACGGFASGENFTGNDWEKSMRPQGGFYLIRR
jgi:hypothetical protein